MGTLLDLASLVMIPSGYKEDKIYSVKPTDGSGDFTFSRGTDTATRVNSSGLIEKERGNTILYSNTFDTGWTSISSTETGGQSGYDGSSDAWLLSKTATDGRLAQLITTGGVQTASVYAKAGTLDWILLLCASGSGDAYLYFDLANGVKGTAEANTIDSTITSVGGGWYRISITFDRTLSAYRLYPADGDGDTSGTSGNIYIQDAQLESGLVATDYIETTTAAVYEGITDNLPRLDYSGGASCPSLLLEPQRTNKITYSEYFQSGWTDNGDITYDFGYLAPDGTNSAYKITNTGNGFVSFIGVLNNDSRSVYARTTSGTGTLQLLTYHGNTNNTFTITEEWQRFEVSSVTTSTGETSFYLVDFRGSTTLDEVIVWGAQCEAGSYPTSYIPTYGTSATRANDVCLKTGVSDLIGQTEGTLFVDFNSGALDGEIQGFSVNNGTSQSRIVIFKNQNDKVEIQVRVSGVVQASILSDDLLANTQYKAALGYANNDVVLYLNGNQVGTDTSAIIPACTNVCFDSDSSGGSPFYKDVNQALLFKTRLSNTELAQLTTL